MQAAKSSATASRSCQLGPRTLSTSREDVFAWPMERAARARADVSSRTDVPNSLRATAAPHYVPHRSQPSTSANRALSSATARWFESEPVAAIWQRDLTRRTQMFFAAGPIAAPDAVRRADGRARLRAVPVALAQRHAAGIPDARARRHACRSRAGGSCSLCASGSGCGALRDRPSSTASGAPSGAGSRSSWTTTASTVREHVDDAARLVVVFHPDLGCGLLRPARRTSS